MEIWWEGITMEKRQLVVCVKIISITEGKRKELVKEKKKNFQKFNKMFLKH